MLCNDTKIQLYFQIYCQNIMSFESCYTNSRIILTEGAIVERLKNEFNVMLDPFVNHAGLLYDFPHALTDIYKEYIEIACRYHLPIMLMTPTRKVNSETHQQSAFRDRPLISDSCNFLKDIKNQYSDYFSPNIFVGGLLGCKGDAYSSEGALDTVAAYKFHKNQVDEFRKKGVDFLFAGIMPALSEAIGLAQAMAESRIPYIISFMIRKDGCLLDGISIAEAIRTIDKSVNPQPLCYMSNCVHPSNLILAIECKANKHTLQMNRFLGIQANASSLTPEELNNCGMLQQENFDKMAEQMLYLVKRHHFKILGGCCGTNGVFIEALAKQSLTKI